jgi:hypothetical protein
MLLQKKQLFVNGKKKKIKMKRNALDPVDYEEEKRKDPKYKTELCKSWIETNFCVYGNRCRFAHGKGELNIKLQSLNYKKKPCSSFLNFGFCPYGSRCNFIHVEKKLNDIIIPYFYIQTFVNNKIHFGKRLKCFEDITSNSSQDYSFDFDEFLKDKNLFFDKVFFHFNNNNKFDLVMVNNKCLEDNALKFVKIC